jgi:Flp pilus assembly protein TadG
MTKRRATWPASDREAEGGSITLELSVLFLALLMSTLFVVETALAWQSRQLTDLAAQAAVNAAQRVGGTEAAGVSAAQSVLDNASFLRNISISVNIGGTEVTAQVQAVTPPLVGVGFPVRSVSAGVVERYVPFGER